MKSRILPCVAAAAVLGLAGCGTTSGPLEPAAPSGPVALARHLDAIDAPPSNPGPHGPRIRIGGESFSYTQQESGVSLDPALFVHVEHPEGAPLELHWSGIPRGRIVGYRWALDIADILDETPRLGPGDLAHWSVWSDDETSTVLPPSALVPGDHLFQVEARDRDGFVSLVTVAIHVVEPEARLSRGGL